MLDNGPLHLSPSFDMRAARTPTVTGKPATKMLAARVTEDLYDAVALAAAEEGVTMSHWLNRLVSERLDVA